MKENIIAGIEAELSHKKIELEKLQQAIAKISILQADIGALERSLAIFKGDKIPESVIIRPAPSSIEPVTPRETVPQIVYSILKEVGKPLKGDEIVSIAKSRGKQVGRNTLMVAIYRAAKKGQLFKIMERGVFGLLEWDKNIDKTITPH